MATLLVGMRRLERPTPTSLTWCANQLRHIPNRTANIEKNPQLKQFFSFFIKKARVTENHPLPFFFVSSVGFTQLSSFHQSDVLLHLSCQ